MLRARRELALRARSNAGGFATGKVRTSAIVVRLKQGEATAQGENVSVGVENHRDGLACWQAGCKLFVKVVGGEGT
jgi:hypothetical protein